MSQPAVQLNRERWQLWPMFQFEGEWSVPDIVWHHIWWNLLQTGKLWKVFYMGYIKTFEQFLSFMQTSGNMPVIIVDTATKEPVALAWTSAYDEGVCNAHFVFIKGLPYPEIGRMVLRHWSSLPGVHLIVGVTPEHYREAWKYALKIGFTKVGIIPSMCPMHYEGRRAPAVISYFVAKED